MGDDVSESDMERVSEAVSRSTGLHFPRERWPELRRAVAAVAAELGLGDPVECARRLAGASALAKEQLDALVHQLTVGETYFYRERRHFDYFADHILPELRQSAGERPIRIWSAGCCTGEEAYSIAIAVRRAIPGPESAHVTVVGTDINARYLRRAEAGLYGHWSFRDVPDWVKTTSFRPREDGQWEVLPEIRRMVRFIPLNLAEEAYPSPLNDLHAVDVIFCRNVLMYFSPAQARRVIERMYRTQREGGWLFVGSTELLHLAAGPYDTVRTPEMIAFRKSGFSRIPAAGVQGASGAGTGAMVEQPERQSAPKVAGDLPGDLRSQALAFQRAGRYEEAVELLRQSLRSGPGPEAEDLVLLARCLANQGNLAKALDCCDQAIGIDPCSLPAQYLRALVLQERGAVEEAIQSLRRVLFLDRDFVLAHVALGTMARDRGQTGEAQRHLRHALEILAPLEPTDILSNAEGMTAGQLAGMVHALADEETAL